MMKAALFDLDGVVFNTEPQYTVFWKSIAKEYRPDIEHFEQKIKGQTLVQIYDRYFADDKAEQNDITRQLNEFEEHMRFDYIPGFKDYIRYLKAQGVKTAVVTSSNKAKMAVVYKQRPDFKQLFDAILTSEDFDKSKPDPDCYLKGAARFNASPKECVVFEDSFNGLKAGRASGAKVIGLATTNKASDIAPYCDEVISNYTHMADNNDRN